MADVRELSAPPDVREEGGTEVLRVFVVERALSVSVQRAFEDPAMWGMLFADVARQVASIYGREAGVSEDEALESIREAFIEGLGAAGEGEARH